MLVCVFGQLLATYPSGLTSTLAVSTGCSRNPRKSKAPSVHTNVSSPTRSTRSPSKVLYCDAGRDYVRAKRSAALHLVHLDDANLGGGEDGVPPLAAEELDDGVG